MLRIPSTRHSKRSQAKLNLLPFADSILVFVFFILMSATFYHINDMGTDVAVASPTEKSNLFLKLTGKELILSSNGSVLHRFQRQARTGEFSYEDVKNVLGEYKKNDRSITFEPENELTFEEIAKIMDIVRSQFSKIIFGNLL
jgi:biopolymer transport protein ExbD